MSLGRSIRSTQFITTYGVGSIIGTREGPSVIRTIKGSGLFQPDGNLDIEDWEIREERLTSILRSGGSSVRIFKLPTNAELNKPEDYPIYKVNPFPEWSRCRKHMILYRLERGQKRGCPRCGSLGEEEAWRKARREAIRFVRVCPKGHMDDVNWHALVHQDPSSCDNHTYRWRGGGSSLSEVTIECTECGESRNFGRAYRSSWSCSGRYPEEGRRREGCSEKSRIIQRNASNIRIPNLITALSIPPQTEKIYNILSHSSIRPLVMAEGLVEKPEDLMNGIKSLVERGEVSGQTLRTLEQEEAENIKEVMAEIREEQAKTRSPEELIQEEFDALRRAAEEGTGDRHRQLFEIEPEEVEFVETRLGGLRIVPVRRLRMVMVQNGYCRISTGEDYDLTERNYRDGEGNFWYPGVDLFGEGIFIDLVDPESGESIPLSVHGDAANLWMRGYQENQDVRHPVFVWWHSLSHRLIKSLAVDSGYSSAAIRERVYSQVDEADRSRAYGGILLFTVQRGGDGTLGGLISLASSFSRVIESALRDIDFCSNDPLCRERQFTPARINGSACYACLFSSETSCDHFNKNLDRNVLRDNKPRFES